MYQNSDQSNSGRKEIEKPLAAKRQRVKSRGQEGSLIKWIAFDSTPIERRSIRGRTPDMRAIFQSGTN